MNKKFVLVRELVSTNAMIAAIGISHNSVTSMKADGMSVHTWTVTVETDCEATFLALCNALSCGYSHNKVAAAIKAVSA